jgi:hypothetical protein
MKKMSLPVESDYATGAVTEEEEKKNKRESVSSSGQDATRREREREPQVIFADLLIAIADQ